MKRHIPNMITCLNLISGLCSIILALWGYQHQAFCFILMAAVFDSCDGAVARALNARSDIGKELDSLADVISFGAAPSIILFSWYYQQNIGPSMLAFVPLLMAAAAALRLAKFNLDIRQSSSFLGLPTPSAAILSASAIAYVEICSHAHVNSTLCTIVNSVWFIPALAAVLSVLMLSEIPMFSIKHINKTPSIILSVSLFLIAAVVANIFTKADGFMARLAITSFLVFIAYLLSNLITLFGSKE
ncbi:MAG: CDP-diacylglycerol--serine O-phosphatidyltransferase [Bacteroidales bacterium]|nr:CDP-diacylglycerol--serine O-phosphatidyltransferase [Bacteroidales bacterium]